MIKVKICGIKRQEDVEFVNKYMPDYVGFVFANSKRKVTMESAKLLSLNLNTGIRKVGVFVNEEYKIVKNIAEALKLDILQFHGSEGNKYINQFNNYEVWKAFSLTSKNDIKLIKECCADAFLIDSKDGNKTGGTGKVFDWNLLKAAKDYIEKPIIAAGGLNENNVEMCIKELNPFGVDVSSGVETEGFKDEAKIRKFIMKVRNF
ncbi:N-(5'-phosphoribosyl)anthranilate isomerase [Clostridium sp. DMHC 10]|uniref:phosphoribosylanthranilate isomerase n=1 Tax=Clostridium sp. DMHC 10 TaxID=747377 RepID=UPI00069E764D|nr:phosphoribosylanthranilate isomerase [Clostridium sp. DMHC 10]KOF56849.1 N-(5'-phosphoribosyl)anthranilate isomerase [Clostridium sp. DMHC 10]